MDGVGVQHTAAPTRLPALYLSCRDGLTETSSRLVLIDRLIEPDSHIDGVVFITACAGLDQPQLCCGSVGELGVQLSALLSELGYSLPAKAGAEKIETLTSMLFDSSPVECMEIRLGTDMSVRQCRELGQALQSWRARRVLMICLDEIPVDAEPGSYRSPHDPYWRNLMSRWVDEQQWFEALSDTTWQARPGTQQRTLGDSTLCLLHAAFGLGGSQMPERLFGFDLDDDQRTLSGYGWMN